MTKGIRMSKKFHDNDITPLKSIAYLLDIYINTYLPIQDNLTENLV